MNYTNFYDMEREGRAAYQLGDSNCVDCMQAICACESLADWHNQREADKSFDQWLDSRGDALEQPDSFQEWLTQTGDAI